MSVRLEACRGSPEAACSGGGSHGCHAPPSVRKCRSLQGELLEIVDSSLDLSRATFERAAMRIRRQLARIAPGAPVDLGQTIGWGSKVSRAGFGH